MRILYHHRTRGVDAQGIHIAEMVDAFRALGHQVDVYSPFDAGASAKPADSSPGILTRFVKRFPILYELAQIGYNFVALPALLRRASSSDFLYERYSLYSFAGVLAARLRGKPLLLEVNSPLALEHQREGQVASFRLARFIERAICNAAAKVIAVTGPLRDILAGEGVKPGRIVVMPNGIDPAKFAPLPPDAALRHKLGLDGKVVIGFAGWFRPWHGLSLLLQAFLDARLSGRGAAVLLIGDGPARPELDDFVRRNALQASVIFAGPVPHSQVPRYLSLVDIAVQPAANEYCCPMKIIEYLALGKPLVAPRQPNVEELVTDGREACLFPPEDATGLGAALAALVEDHGLRSRMGEAARAAIARRGFLWSRNAERVVDLANQAKTA